MAKKTRYVTVEIPDKFLDATVPEFELFKVNLTQECVFIEEIKTGSRKFFADNYTLKINRSALSKSIHNELYKELKQILNIDFIPFNWDSGEFKYYTTNKTGDIEFKKQQLINTFDFLKDFEKKYKIKKEASLEEFKQDKVSFESYADEEFLVKFNKEKNAYIVLALLFLGTDKYRLLSNASTNQSKFEESGLDKDFFSELSNKKIAKKMCFTINPYEYNQLKELIEGKKKAKDSFIKEQKEITKENINSFIEYNEKNIFDFKIKFNEEKQCFDFFCKGYKDPSADKFGNYPTRGLLARWALNFILSEELKPEELENALYNTHDAAYEIDLENHYKVLLDIQPDSSARDKNFWVPSSEWSKLNKMYDKFMETNKIFSKPEKNMRIDGLVNLLERHVTGVDLERYPAIYMDGKGDSFLIYQYRNISGVRKKENAEPIIGDSYTGMKGVPLSMGEVDYFLENHPLSSQIKSNTIYLNSEIWMNAKAHQNILLTPEEREKAFHDIYLHAKLASQTKGTKNNKRLKL